MSIFKLNGGKVMVKGMDGTLQEYIVKLPPILGVPAKYFEQNDSASRVASIQGRAVWEFKMENCRAFFSLMMTCGLLSPRQVIEYMYPQARQYRAN